MTHAISWFEIPVTDIDRATKFYEAIFGISLAAMDMEGTEMRMFPVEDPMQHIGGALVAGPDTPKPSTEGTLVYLNGSPDLQHVLGKVEAAGGKVIQEKVQITPDYGHMGLFVDTEGNKIGLHSME